MNRFRAIAKALMQPRSHSAFMRWTGPVVATAMFLALAPFTQASPFAVEVIDFTPGGAGGAANPTPFQTDGSQALGAPSRDTGLGNQVGVFYPPFTADELVLIGPGGELTLRMGSKVTDDPSNPFGIDMIVHGNSPYIVAGGVAVGLSPEPGDIEVSADGVNFFPINGVEADTAFPTLGYSDTSYTGNGNLGGTIETDWQLPVDPSFNAIGLTEEQISAGYAGSAGGTGVDLFTAMNAADYIALPFDPVSGLRYIEYVRISQPLTDLWSTEVQAIVNVSYVIPEPASMLLLAAGGLLMLPRRRK